ncbi:hypothetical protein PCASD_08144 [Puccinia coronata f. sp. avenae]|uniref:Rho-GAP domain-containing protein n=1 Tax=Puccinia coronata f. sp. avenae TaxID=200324 RepID=A0A2N5VA58_9BASI|nr:hypothetical protein PCASD_08144 [Puccinia coronata f. sp. avenae]
MSSSLIHNSDGFPNIPAATLPLRSRTSSLLPIPTRRETSMSSSLRSSSNSSQPNHSPTPSRARGTSTPQRPSLHSSQYSTSSVRSATRLPGRQPSIPSNYTSLKPTPPSSNNIVSPASLRKPVPSALPGLKKHINKANDDSANYFRDLTKSLSRVPRKSPTSITIDKPFPIPTSLAASAKAQRSGPRPAVTSSALPPAPAHQHSSMPPGAVTYQNLKARPVRSYQELNPTPNSTAGSALRPVQPLCPPTKKVDTSPQSLQSTITLTDGASSIRVKLDYSHRPSVSPIVDLYSKVTPSTYGSKSQRYPIDIHEPPQVLSSSPAQCPEPQEFQSRAYTLEKLQSLIGTDELQKLVNPDDLYQLISRSSLYETQQEIQERVSKESNTSNTPDGQKPPAVPLTSMDSNSSQVHSTPAIPRATLKATAFPVSAMTQPLNLKGPSILPIAATPSVPDAGLKKSNNVGNILLDKLRWKSKTPAAQNSKHGTSKSISKSRRPSSFILSSSSIKGILPGQQSTFGKVLASEQRRFSQILGASLELMNCSTRVVLMGERYHVLPVLSFDVIEEIYRRGMQVPGIMRISGDLDRIDELVHKFECCPTMGVDLSGEDIHTLCGLLKHYLRTLPEPLFHPLLSHILFTVCVEPSRARQADSTADENSSQLLVARYLLKLLPSRALSLLTYVVRFLAQIPFFTENRIQHDSLAVMLGPAIFAPRDIGLPGLGLHPRRHNTDQAASQAIPWRLPSHASVSFIEDLDKKAVSQRAAESTLWLMNHSNMLFDGAGKPRELVLSTTMPEEAQGSTPHELFPIQFAGPEPTSPEQLRFSPSINSLAASILTYTSGLTVSQGSMVFEESPEFLPSSSIQSPPSPSEETGRLDDFQYMEDNTSVIPDKPQDSTEDTSNAGLGLAFPSSLVEQADSTLSDVMEGEEGEALSQLDQSAGDVTCTDHDATSKEVDTRERKTSSKVVGLLAQYMEGRDEKIQKQESLIDSLVGEIERLQSIEERDSALRGQILKEAHLNPLALRQEGDLVRSDGRNEHAELVSAQTSPQVPRAGEIYVDYYEQIFNPFSPKRATFGLSESCSSAMANRAVQDEQAKRNSLSSDSTVLDPVNTEQTHDAGQSKNRPFADSQENVAEDNTIEELLPLPTQPGKRSSALPSQIPRSGSNPKPWAEHSERVPLHATQSDDDYDSDPSNTISLRTEISRLRSINSNLIRKLKSIESIVGDVFFP